MSFTDRDGNARLDVEAKALCGRCPAAVACLATATLDDLGIRGGHTWDERRALGQRTKPQYRRATRGVA